MNAAFSMVLADLEQLAEMQQQLIEKSNNNKSGLIDAREDEIMAVELF
jgi:hypothetical protein